MKPFPAVALVVVVLGFTAIKDAFAQTILPFTDRLTWEASLTEASVTEDFSDTNLVADISVISPFGKTTNGVWFDDVNVSENVTVWAMTNATYAWGGTFDLTPGSLGSAAGLKFQIRLMNGSLMNVPAEVSEGNPSFFGFICNEPFYEVRVSARIVAGFNNEIYSLDDLSFSTGSTNTATWIQSIDGSWSTPSNWDINAIPSVRNNATIDPSVSVTVTGTAGKTFVRSLTLSSTNTGIATLLLQTNTGLWAKEAINVGANGHLLANREISAASLNTAVGSTMALNGNTELRAPAVLNGAFEVGPHNVTFFQNAELRGPVSLGGGTMTASVSVTLFSELHGAGNVIGLVPSVGSSLVSTGILNFNSHLASLSAELNANGNLIAITMPSTPETPARFLGAITLNGGSINFPEYVFLAPDTTVDSGTLRFGELQVTNTFSVAADSTVITEAIPLTGFNHQLIIRSNLVLGVNSALQVDGRFFGYGTVVGTNVSIEATDDLYLGRGPSLPPLRLSGVLTVKSPNVVLEHLNLNSGILRIEGNLESGGSGSRATAGTDAVIIYSGSISNSGSCNSDVQFIFDGAGTHRIDHLLKSTGEQFDARVEFTSNAIVEMTLQGEYNPTCERERVSSKIIFNAAPDFSGTLRVIEGQGFSFAFGDTVSLFEFNGTLPTNGFDTVILPGLPEGLIWFTNHLYVTGAFRIASTNDTDIDGLADIWELDQFENLLRDGNGDFDGDGASDLSEFISGTDPKSAASLFSIRTFTTNPNDLVLRAGPIVAGRIYTLEQSYDLTPFSWYSTGESAPEEVAGEIQFSFSRPLDSFFYRVKISVSE